MKNLTRNIKCKTLCLLAFLLSSCAMEEAFEPVVPEVETELPDSVFFILADPVPLTRVTYAGDGLHADFEKEDLVGCFALNDDLTAAEGDGFKPNACYRVSVHTNITTGEDRRFLSPVTDSDDLNKSKSKYLFYYPYDPEITSLDQLKKFTHSVNTDQNDRDRYEASDLLWDICIPDAAKQSVYVEMDHAMAQIIVEVESGLIKEGTVPTLLNIPTTVSKLDLVKPDLATMTADMGVEGSYELAEDSRKSITMWEFGYATSGNLMFRAAVPANHTISSGSLAVQITKPDDTPAKYRLSKALNFEPGKNYRLTLVSEKETTTPGEVGDDDTWVYDVLDPETMAPVGLLCREYVRYQPGVAVGGDEYVTGVGYDRASAQPVQSLDSDTKFVNSQAWVYYKLQPGTTIPDLSTGQVLQFLYDVRANADKSFKWYRWDSDGNITGIGGDTYTSHCWPEPHHNTYGTGGSSSGGFFASHHGHLWVTVIDPDNPSIRYGYSYQPDLQRYIDREDRDGEKCPINRMFIENGMHGGMIKWGKENGNSHYSIIDYSLPTDQTKNGRDVITNQIAEDYGHIAILDDGNTYVSYENPAAVKHKIGVITPRYLVDRRIGRTRGVEERLYPIVKIGFNQFWMSQSLRAATLNDGTSVVNYNSKTPGGITYNHSVDSETPGFVYYSSANPEYNPYFQFDSQERENYKLSVLYNFASVISSKILPLVVSGQNYTCYFANTQAVTNLYNYLGTHSQAKIMTRRSRIRTNNAFDENRMSVMDTYIQGAYGSGTLGWHMANICGFDLRVDGAYYGYGGFYDIANKALMWCVDDVKSQKYFVLADYDVFEKTPSGNLTEPNTNQSMFLPIRFFMKFDGQADSEVDKSSISLSSLAKGLATKSSSAPVESRDVYIGLEAVE